MHVRCIFPPKACNNLAGDFTGKKSPPPNEDVLFQCIWNTHWTLLYHLLYLFINPFFNFTGEGGIMYFFKKMRSFLTKYITEKCNARDKKQDIIIEIPFLCG